MGLPRQLATWLLSALADVAAAGFMVAGVAAAAMATGAQPRHQVWSASLGAAVLTIGLAGLVAARVLGDVAAARAAILGEGPARAFAGATRRLMARPGSFLLGGLAATLAGVAVTAALQPAAGVLAAASGRIQGAALVGPQLMLATFASLAAAVVELAWLGTASALACAEGDGGGRRAPSRASAP